MEQPFKSATGIEMKPMSFALSSRNRHIALVALLVIGLDQLTKGIIFRVLAFQRDEKIIINGFFKLVHWGNTGAAWSLFRDNNRLLAVVAVLALGVLILSRHHFDARTLLGQVGFGLIFGGIIGNLIDRIWAGHVIDFLRFYIQRSNGEEIGFPAFNVADSAICTGVGLIFLLTWKSERHGSKPPSANS